MAGLTYRFEVERRPAMLREYEYEPSGYGVGTIQHFTGNEARVLVYMSIAKDGMLLVEYESGRCGYARPQDIRFLDSKSLFDEQCWYEQIGERDD